MAIPDEPKPAASDAAKAVARIEAVSWALMTMSPVVVRTPWSASWMYAADRVVDRVPGQPDPTEIATDVPPKAAANDTAPAKDVIRD